jgi:hypothetical protein
VVVTPRIMLLSSSGDEDAEDVALLPVEEEEGITHM